MDEHVNINPRYEIELIRGRIIFIVFSGFFLVGIILIYLILVKEGTTVNGLVISAIVALMPLGVVIFLRQQRVPKSTLTQFVNSISGLVVSWAVVRQPPSGLDNAYFQLSDGRYLKFELDLSRRMGYHAVLLAISKFITQPESVSKAPIIKIKFDKKALEPTVIPILDKMMEPWKNGDEKWKRSIVEDETIRSWILRHSYWTKMSRGDKHGAIYSIGVFVTEGYERNPNVRDGWLKGKYLTSQSIFRRPKTDEPSNTREFYLEMIDIGQKIMHHIEEDKDIRTMF